MVTSRPRGGLVCVVKATVTFCSQFSEASFHLSTNSSTTMSEEVEEPKATQETQVDEKVS